MIRTRQAFHISAQIVLDIIEYSFLLLKLGHPAFVLHVEVYIRRHDNVVLLPLGLGNC